MIRNSWATALATLVITLVTRVTVAHAAESGLVRTPRTGGIYVIAHRGAHVDAPENSLPAYRQAIELGADFVEIDVRTTKDGELVSIHNRSVDAYVADGSTGLVADLTLDEVRSLDIGARVAPKWRGTHPPTLDEILQLCQGRIGVYLDLKDADLSKVAGIVRKYSMQRDVVWCIAPRLIEPLRSVCPECIAMPDPESEETVSQLIEAAKPKVVAPVWNEFSATFAATCHAAGILVFVDEREPTEQNWKLALDWGADGIQTDNPRQLIAFLRDRTSHDKANPSITDSTRNVGPDNDRSTPTNTPPAWGSVADTTLAAGTAHIDLTPPAQYRASLGGYGERMSRPAEGVRDPVLAKAVVVTDSRHRRFALLTADILGFPPPFHAQLMSRLADDGWQPEQVLLLPSHSHTSIDMNAINSANILGNKQIGIFDKKLQNWTLQQCELVIRNAAQSLTPIAVGTSSTTLVDWNRNRRKRDGETDQSLTVTRIDDTNGKPIAALVNFTAHPTFMSANEMFFSGGWPGHLQRALERMIGGGVNVLYFNGAEGDQSPISRPGTGDDRWKAARRYGHDLAAEAYRLWQTTATQREVAFGFHSESFDLPDRKWHPDFMKTGGDEYALTETLLRQILPIMFPSKATSGCVRLGELAIVGVPGEMTAELGIHIKQEIARDIGAQHVVIGGLANAWISYILSPHEYDRGGYEASVSFYGRELGDQVVAGAILAGRQLRLPNNKTSP